MSAVIAGFGGIEFQINIAMDRPSNRKSYTQASEKRGRFDMKIVCERSLGG
jgi:hypothetical protein